MIGADVVVTVLEVRPDLVRIGIDAPRNVEVHREEVFVEVQQANQQAASPSTHDVAALAADLRDSERSGKPEQPSAGQPKPKPPNGG